MNSPEHMNVYDVASVLENWNGELGVNYGIFVREEDGKLYKATEMNIEHGKIVLSEFTEVPG